MSIGFERKTPPRPRLLLAYVDSYHAAQAARSLRRHGWEVHLAASGTEVYHLVQELQPQVVVVDTEIHDESGWLIAAKITLDPPAPRVILLTSHVSECDADRAAQVGASAVVARCDGAETLVEEIVGRRLAWAV